MHLKTTFMGPGLALFFASTVFGCASSGSSGDTSSDVDADIDTDTDVDTDSDSDADSDSDGDSDTDTDSDLDTDTDTDLDTDTDTDSDTDTDTDSDTDTDTDSDTDTDTDSDTYECDGLITFTKHTIDDSFQGAESIYTADLDGDSDLDVLGAAQSIDSITWWENIVGDGSTWTEYTIADSFDGAYAVHAVDLDGDSDLDVLGAAFNATSITWWENTAGDGSTWTEHFISVFHMVISIYAADLDGDSDMDVLGAAMVTNSVAWWENTAGDGSIWTQHIVDGSFDCPVSVKAADMDGDSDLDVLGAAVLDDDITWWENIAGDGSTWTEHIVDDFYWGVSSVHAADVDGDSDLDVLGADGNANLITWWDNVEGDGSTWIEHTISNTFDGAMSADAADLDGDSDLDVLGAATIGDDITWWENIAGDGSSWAECTIDDAFEGAASVHAADLDGDSDLDALGVSFLADAVVWWGNSLFP